VCPVRRQPHGKAANAGGTGTRESIGEPNRSLGDSGRFCARFVTLIDLRQMTRDYRKLPKVTENFLQPIKLAAGLE